MSEQRPILTTRQGHPVSDNQSLRSVGERGPATLENYQFIEKITHFDRERIPERVVHARGTGAHGYFEAYGTIGGEPAHKYTRARVLNEVRRVLTPGSTVYITEVMNSSFLLDPYSPNTWRYWMAFNDFQHEHGGDPFVGAKLGNLLLAGGYRDVATEVKTFYFDNREPGRRKVMIGFWEELLLSAADVLIEAGAVTQDIVDGMRREMHQVQNDPNAVFFYSFIQAKATVF